MRPPKTSFLCNESRLTMKRAPQVIASALGASVLLGIGFFVGRSEGPPPVVGTAIAADEPKTSAEGVVQLSAEKLAAAELKTAIAQGRPMALTRLVPARLQYDDRRHIAIKVVTDGVLTQMLVKPGDTVSEGQALAQVSSPEIGTARADLMLKESERQLADEKFQWASVTSENVTKLVASIRKHATFEDIEKQFARLNLGDDREKLLAAYSKFLLNESLSASLQSIGDSGAVASKTLKERQSERQAAQATLDGLCEVALFEARIERQKAGVAAVDAERRLEISRQHLHSLIGQTQTRPVVMGGSDAVPDDDGMNSDLSEISLMTVKAPFSGTIESREFSANERVKQGDELFILADTQTLWVKAEIRERDWRAIALNAGQKLTVTIPALPDARFDATLHYVGREVSTESNSVPLVAVVENTKGLLRPGLFAHVALPLTEEREVLTVPSSAVVEHEGHKFVFVMESEDRFRRVDVLVGETTSEWVEIRKGLKSGEKVISHGAFLLKSELLLEAEE